VRIKTATKTRVRILSSLVELIKFLSALRESGSASQRVSDKTAALQQTKEKTAAAQCDYGGSVGNRPNSSQREGKSQISSRMNCHRFDPVAGVGDADQRRRTYPVCSAG